MGGYGAMGVRAGEGEMERGVEARARRRALSFQAGLEGSSREGAGGRGGEGKEARRVERVLGDGEGEGKVMARRGRGWGVGGRSKPSIWMGWGGLLDVEAGAAGDDGEGESTTTTFLPPSPAPPSASPPSSPSTPKSVAQLPTSLAPSIFSNSAGLSSLGSIPSLNSTNLLPALSN